MANGEQHSLEPSEDYSDRQEGTLTAEEWKRYEGLIRECLGIRAEQLIEDLRQHLAEVHHIYQDKLNILETDPRLVVPEAAR